MPHFLGICHQLFKKGY